VSDQFERQLQQHLAQEAAQVKYFPRPLASRIEAAVPFGHRPATIRQVALAAGLVVLAVLLAVGLSQARSPRSQPAGVAGPWKENLTFSGAVTGTVHSTVADEGAARSTCSGRFSVAAGAWSSNFVIKLAGKLYYLEITVVPYSGPGTYSNSPSSSLGPKVSITDLDGTIGWWGNNASAPASFSVDPGHESGTLDATLTRTLLASGDLPSDLDEKLHVSGRWTCRTKT